MDDPFSELICEVLNEIPPRLRLNSVDATKEFAILACDQTSNHDSSYQDTMHLEENGATSDLLPFLSKETSSLRRQSAEEVCKLLEIDEDELHDDMSVCITVDDDDIKYTSCVISVPVTGCTTTPVDCYPAINQPFDTQCDASPINIETLQNDNIFNMVNSEIIDDKTSSKSTSSASINGDFVQGGDHLQWNNKSCENVGNNSPLGDIPNVVHSPVNRHICEHNHIGTNVERELYHNSCIYPKSLNTTNEDDITLNSSQEGSTIYNQPNTLNQPDSVEYDSFLPHKNDNYQELPSTLTDGNANICIEKTLVGAINSSKETSASIDKQSDDLNQSGYESVKPFTETSDLKCMDAFYEDINTSQSNDTKPDPPHDSCKNYTNLCNDKSQPISPKYSLDAAVNMECDVSQESEGVTKNSMGDRKRKRDMNSRSKMKRKTKNKMTNNKIDKFNKKLRKRNGEKKSKVKLENGEVVEAGFLNGAVVSQVSRNQQEPCFEKIMYRDDAILLKQKRKVPKVINADITHIGDDSNSELGLLNKNTSNRTKENVQCGTYNNTIETVNMEHSSYRDCRNSVTGNNMINDIHLDFPNNAQVKKNRRKTNVDQPSSDMVEPQRIKSKDRKRLSSISSDDDTSQEKIDSINLKSINEQSKSKGLNSSNVGKILKKKHLLASRFEEDTLPSSSGTSTVRDELSNYNNVRQSGDMTSERRHSVISCEESSDSKPYVNILRDHLSRDKILRLLSILQNKKL